jgi:hypothetical protein
MWIILFFIYISIAGVLYYFAEKKGIVVVEKFEDKVGLSTIALLWPLIALSFAPWALSKAIDLIEKVAEKKRETNADSSGDK